MLCRKTSAEEFHSTLGEAIRRQRELAELPMRQLAAMVGISNPYLHAIANLSSAWLVRSVTALRRSSHGGAGTGCASRSCLPRLESANVLLRLSGAFSVQTSRRQPEG